MVAARHEVAAELAALDERVAVVAAGADLEVVADRGGGGGALDWPGSQWSQWRELDVEDPSGAWRWSRIRHDEAF